MAKKHFFQPLLPGFHSHLTIPAAFFSKYIDGRNDQTTAKLRSDASKITWEVRIEDGQKLTVGWKEFALAHDLRIGDILIFRQEKDMAFHVTLLGPSCCEIQYESCLDDDHNLGLGKVREKKKVKKNPRKERESSSLDPSCFVSTVAPSTLRYDALYFPISFTRENGLGTRRGEIVLMNEKGTSWTLPLRQKQCGSTYIRGGWRSFCMANGLKAGDLFTFKVIQGGRSPVLRFHVTLLGPSSCEIQYESCSDDDHNLEKKKVKKNPKREAESCSLDPSCFLAKVTPSTLRCDSLNLPKSFVRANGLETRCEQIFLENGKGTSWTLALKQKQCGNTYIRGGWRSFCSANGLSVGSFFIFKLIKRGGTLVLRKSPFSIGSEDCSEGDEIESLSTQSDSDEEINQDEKSFKKPRSIWKPSSSSPSQNQFVTLTLTPYSVKRSILFLPLHFTDLHGITVGTKMCLLDKNGVRWSTKLRSEGNRIRLTGGWKDFFKANCVMTGESVMLKLILNEDTSCALQFCSKVKP